VLGPRDRERRVRFHLPEGLQMSNFPPMAGGYGPNQHHDPHAIFNPYLDPTLTWKDLEWLRSITRLPVLVKGVIAAEDAVLAIGHGAAGVVVSNHGGRNLDTVPATAEALPPVVEAVAGRVPVLVDGGIRRGSDVAKALALGATAVLVGRAPLWGLAAAGAAGVARVLELLHLELQVTMALLGVRSIEELGPEIFWNGR
jgi:4-hydroxymandelate oxidase